MCLFYGPMLTCLRRLLAVLIHASVSLRVSNSVVRVKRVEMETRRSEVDGLGQSSGGVGGGRGRCVM